MELASPAGHCLLVRPGGAPLVVTGKTGKTGETKRIRKLSS